MKKSIPVTEEVIICPNPGYAYRASWKQPEVRYDMKIENDSIGALNEEFRAAEGEVWEAEIVENKVTLIKKISDGKEETGQ